MIDTNKAEEHYCELAEQFAKLIISQDKTPENLAGSMKALATVMVCVARTCSKKNALDLVTAAISGAFMNVAIAEERANETGEEVNNEKN